MEILGIICFMLIATSLVTIIPRYTGRHIILKRIQAYRSLHMPETLIIHNYDSSRQILLAVFSGIIAVVCLFFYPQWHYIIIACYIAFIIIACILIKKIQPSSRQTIEIKDNALRLVDWNGIASPVLPQEIRYVHFYQSRSAKGWPELFPRVTLYRSRPKNRTAYARHRTSLLGTEHSLGHDGMEYINHLHITPKEYVLLARYCADHHIPVEDDYAANMLSL